MSTAVLEAKQMALNHLKSYHRVTAEGNEQVVQKIIDEAVELEAEVEEMIDCYSEYNFKKSQLLQIERSLALIKSVYEMAREERWKDRSELPQTENSLKQYRDVIRVFKERIVKPAADGLKPEREDDPFYTARIESAVPFRRQTSVAINVQHSPLPSFLTYAARCCSRTIKFFLRENSSLDVNFILTAEYTFMNNDSDEDIQLRYFKVDYAPTVTRETNIEEWFKYIQETINTMITNYQQRNPTRPLLTILN